MYGTSFCSGACLWAAWTLMESSDDGLMDGLVAGMIDGLVHGFVD